MSLNYSSFQLVLFFLAGTLFSISPSLALGDENRSISNRVGDIQLSEGQINTICNSMLKNFKTAQVKVEEYTKVSFKDAYPNIGCKNLDDNNRVWPLLGHSLTEPPSSRALSEASALLRYFHKNSDVVFLNYLFENKDKKGRDVYAYLDHMKRAKPNQDRYYNRFYRVFKRYDIHR